MAICFGIMTILSLPSLIFAYYGSHIPDVDHDSLGLYRFTIGNVGYDPGSATYAVNSMCLNQGKHYNGTCLHIPTFKLEVTFINASYIITACEFVQILIFFITVYHLNKRMHEMTKLYEAKRIVVSSYAVEVKGVPADTSVAELVDHFSALYPLDKPDWRNRPAFLGARPVEHCDNTGVPVYVNSWVAECSLHKKIGKFIRAFEKNQRVNDELLRSRAAMKMYAPDTPHAKGSNIKKLAKAEKKMLQIAAKMDKITLKLFHASYGLKADQEKEKKGENDDDEEENEKKTDNKDKLNKFHDQMDAPVVCAFVVFEYSESFARCVEDYASCSTLPWSLCYPSKLKFRGYEIKVRRAPEPDEIWWENLEVDFISKQLSRGRTTIFTIVFIAVAFVIILQASLSNEKFSLQVPHLSYCTSIVPSLYEQMDKNVSSVSSMEITRPLVAAQVPLDAACNQVMPSSFYAMYTIGGDLKKPVGAYDVRACTSKGSLNASLPAGFAGGCPHSGQRTFCPCMSLTDSEVCFSRACNSSVSLGSASSGCHTFPASTMGSCFCYSQLGALLSTSSGGGAGNLLSKVQDLGTNFCKGFIINYSTAISLQYLSSFTTVIINRIILEVIKYLTVFEYHTSLDKREASLLLKTFVASYFNLAIVVLVAYGSIPQIPVGIRENFFIFNGEYEDFTVGWYGNVGEFLVLTFILQAISPLFFHLFNFLIFAPLKRFVFYPYINAQTSTWFVWQKEVDALALGPKMDVTSHQAQLLSLVFFAMTYGPGIPVLIILSYFTFWLYFTIDKMMLLQYFEKPRHMGPGVMGIVITCLTLAGVVR